jgi:uncharacterized protein
VLEKIVKVYTKWMIKLFIPAAIVIVAITWIAFPKTISIFKKIQTDFKSLLPKSYESVKRMDDVNGLFGSLKNMTLVLETNDPSKTKPMIPELGEFLEADPEVDYVNWRKPGYDFFDEHKLFYPSAEDLVDLEERIDRRIQREKLGSLYISFDDEDSDKDAFGDLKAKYGGANTGKITSEFYTNERETVFLMAVYPVGENLNISNFKKFATHIKGKIKEFDLKKHDPTVNIYYTGGVISSTHEYDSLMNDLKTAGIVSGIIILLLILFYFRTARALIFVAIPLGCGIIWNFAIAYYTIGHLNMTTAFLFSILFGLGIDFGIHLNSRYNEERLNGANLIEALGVMFTQTGRSSVIAGLTTAAAFIVLVMNDFKGFSEFGSIAGIGILVTLVAYLLILPILFAAEEKIPFLKRKKFKMAGWHLEKISNLKTKPALIILASSVTISILLAGLFLRFDYNFANFRSPNIDLDYARELEHTVNPQKAIPSVILVHSKEEALGAERAIKRIINENQDSLINNAKSVYSLVPKDQKEKVPTMRRIKVLLEDDVIDKLVKGEDKEKIEGLKKSSAANPFTLDKIPQKIKEAFVHKETGEENQLVYIFLHPEVDLKNGELAMALADDIRNIPGDDGNTYHAISSSVIFADVLSVMLKDSKKAIALSFLMVFVLLLIDFRSFKYTLITMVPLLSGISLMLGVMALTGIDLNFFNMIVLPVVLGIGIDDGVHFFHRFQEEGYKNVDRVLMTTGGAIVMTTLTTVAGFAGMCFAHHGGLSSIGIAADIGLITCLITTLIFFPAVLRTIWLKKLNN